MGLGLVPLLVQRHGHYRGWVVWAVLLIRVADFFASWISLAFVESSGWLFAS